MTHNPTGRHSRPPLPGMKPSGPADQHDYLILLQEVPLEGEGRTAVVAANEERTNRFRRFLAGWLEQEHLDHQVWAIGEAMAFPMLAITCTSSVAERIQQLPEVDGIVPDTDAFHFIR